MAHYFAQIVLKYSPNHQDLQINDTVILVTKVIEMIDNFFVHHCRPPEVLRNVVTTDATTENFQLSELQKIDIYAFAVLLYQLQTQSTHPFGIQRG